MADPPEYQDPGRTPPFLNLALATPRVLDIQVIDLTTNPANANFSVNVPVRSDDKDTTLMAALHLDYSYPKGGTVIQSDYIPAATLSDLSRKIDLSITIPNTTQGCHQVTLLVAHYDNWAFRAQAPKPEAKDDIAIATWWLNVVTDPNADPWTLKDCPNRNEVQKGK